MDALRIYEVMKSRLDEKYLEKWVKKIEVDALYQHLLKEAFK